jgi:hypothetical protein
MGITHFDEARSADFSLGHLTSRWTFLGSRPVRSTHVHGSEYVLDEYAPPAMFHAVFLPIRHSLRLLRTAGA